MISRATGREPAYRRAVIRSGAVPVALSFHLTALPFLALAVGLATLALLPALLRGEVVVRLGFTMIGLCALPWAATTALAACVDDGPSLLPFMRAAFAPIPLVGSGLLIVMLGVAGRIEGHRRIVVVSVVLNAALMVLCASSSTVVAAIAPTEWGLPYPRAGYLYGLFVTSIPACVAYGAWATRGASVDRLVRATSRKAVLGVGLLAVLAISDVFLTYGVFGVYPVSWLPSLIAVGLSLYAIVAGDVLNQRGVDRAAVIEAGVAIAGAAAVTVLAVAVRTPAILAIVTGGYAAAMVAIGRTLAMAAPPPQARDRTQAAFRGDPALLPPLVRDLEDMLAARRDEWSATTARGLFDAIIDVAETRKRSADHEQRWLGLAGLCLRPGTGAPLDAWRIKQMWGVFNEGPAFGKTEASRLAWWIVWRRVAGGMTAGQQEQIYDRLAKLLLPNALQQKKLAEVKASRQELGEMWRAVASLERLPVAHKLKLGDELMRRMDTRKGREDAVLIWALGRIGARVPLYGPHNTVVPASKVAAWLGTVLGWDWPEPDKAAFAIAQLARRTDDRARDVDEAMRARAAAAVRQMPGGERGAVLIEQVVTLEAREERVVLGDTLPAGLRLVGDVDG